MVGRTLSTPTLHPSTPTLYPSTLRLPRIPLTSTTPIPGAVEWKIEVVKKTAAEIERIKAALKGNFLFAHLPPSQASRSH